MVPEGGTWRNTEGTTLGHPKPVMIFNCGKIVFLGKVLDGDFCRSGGLGIYICTW